MAGTRKYEGLPDLVRDKRIYICCSRTDIGKDAAPDVYETPELADDVSTLQVLLSASSPSSSSSSSSPSSPYSPSSTVPEFNLI
jgi:hypothetical protein